MARILPCGFTAETVFKSPVCDLMGLDGRLHRKKHEAVIPQPIRKKEIMGDDAALSHSSLSASNCFVCAKP